MALKKKQKQAAPKSAKTAAHPYTIGESYLVRSVTHYHVGRLVAVYAGELVLADASWVADTGRFHEALKSGTLSEVEPFPDPVTVSRGGIIDVTLWRHALPRAVK